MLGGRARRVTGLELPRRYDPHSFPIAISLWHTAPPGHALGFISKGGAPGHALQLLTGSPSYLPPHRWPINTYETLVYSRHCRSRLHRLELCHAHAGNPTRVRSHANGALLAGTNHCLSDPHSTAGPSHPPGDATHPPDAPLSSFAGAPPKLVIYDSLDNSDGLACRGAMHQAVGTMGSMVHRLGTLLKLPEDEQKKQPEDEQMKQPGVEQSAAVTLTLGQSAFWICENNQWDAS